MEQIMSPVIIMYVIVLCCQWLRFEIATGNHISSKWNPISAVDIKGLSNWRLAIRSQDISIDTKIFPEHWENIFVFLSIVYGLHTNTPVQLSLRRISFQGQIHKSGRTPRWWLKSFHGSYLPAFWIWPWLRSKNAPPFKTPLPQSYYGIMEGLINMH